MATMNVSLPKKMKDWVEKEVETGRYANASDYVRDLVRRDQRRSEGIVRLQAAIDEGRNGPFQNVDPKTLFEDIRQHTRTATKKTYAA